MSKQTTETQDRSQSAVNGIVMGLVLLMATACTDSRKSQVIITHHEKETTKWGCLNVSTRTWVKDLETGQIDMLCGNIGAIGDTVSGYWIYSWDDSRDGFTYKTP